MSPWMSKIEIDTIVKYLDKNSVMLEYGSGGSTSYFSKFVKEYYSIEHNQDWYKKIQSSIPENVRSYYVKQSKTASNKIVAKNWEGLSGSSRFQEFYEYIQYPKELNTKFDCVLIDGRARPECAKFIIDFLHDDGYVFIHDYWERGREYYRTVEQEYTIVESIKSGQSLVVLKKSNQKEQL